MVACRSCGTDNPEGARFCSQCGAPLAAERSGTDADEVRKVVTILFADVAGSTAVGERLDPETLRRVMSRHFDEAKRLVEEHGGVVEKFIGDAVMAVFGIPRVHEDDALRAVRAAAAVRDRLAALDAELRDQLGISIAWRIGVNTGQVVAGDAGAGQRFVTGDAVNLAKRLEEAAGSGEIVIGEATHRLVRDAVTAEPLDAVTVKGKGEPVRAHRLLSVAGATTGPARRADAPMVGRARQRQALDDALAQAIGDRVCVLFTILGSAGVGKSRLVSEFLGGLDREIRLLRGRCLSYGDGITYWPIRDMVQTAAGIAETDPPAEGRAKIDRLLAEVGVEAEPERARIGDRVAEAIGLAEGAADPGDIFTAVRGLFERLARERPLVLVFDDVHWAEPNLLDLVENVADWSRDAPILLVCVGRRELLEARPTWAGGKLAATTIQLEPLSASESEELVAGLLGEATLDPPVRRRIADAADGNPLFVEELLGMLIDDGSLVRQNGNWVAARDISSIEVPPTVQALLAARLDRLARPERSVMECGAVEGKVFHAGAVTALVPDQLRPEVNGHLMSLMRKELVRPDRSEFSGEEAYRFRHLLIRDAAYEAMPKQARAELHQRFADWLEVASGPRRAEYEEILGHHLAQAHRYRTELAFAGTETDALERRASDYLASAGDRARNRGDFAGARQLLERALALVGAGERRPAVLEALAEALEKLGEPQVALERIEEALAAYRAREDAVGEARAEVARLWLVSYLESVEMKETQARAEELGDVLDRAGDLEGWATATFLAGTHLFFIGRATDGIERLEATRARLPENSRLRAQSAGWISGMHFWGPTPVDEAVIAIERLRAEHAGWVIVQGAVGRHLGGLIGMRGDFATARAELARAKAIAAEAGLLPWAQSTDSHFGVGVELLAGEPQRAVEISVTSYEAMAATGDLAFSGTAAANVAAAYAELGQWDEAERYARIALDTTAASDVSAQAAGRSVLALVRAHGGHPDEAERLARDGLAIIGATDYVNQHADAWRVLGGVLELAGGRHDEAGAAFSAALALYRRKGNLVMTERMERRLEG